MISNLINKMVDPASKRPRLEKRLADLRENLAWLEAHIKKMKNLEAQSKTLPKKSDARIWADAELDKVRRTTLPPSKSAWLSSVVEIKLQIQKLEARLKTLSQ